MLLIGGYSIASGDIIVKTLGHEYNIETIVKAGSDYDIAEQITKYDNIFIVMQRDLKELKNQISATLSNGVVSRLAKTLLVKQQMMKKKFEILKNKRKELKDSASKPSGSKIIVSGKIYPGVEIYIDGYKFKVTEIMQSKIFSASAKDEGIVVTNR